MSPSLSRTSRSEFTGGHFFGSRSDSSNESFESSSLRHTQFDLRNTRFRSKKSHDPYSMKRTPLLISGATLMNRYAQSSSRLRHKFGFVLLPAALLTATLAQKNQPPRSQIRQF